MEPFRFVHAADLHIDSPFEGLLAVDQGVGERLRDATYDAFKNLIQLCKEEKASFLVIAGDVYDGADRSPRAQLRFRNGLDELAGEGIESFVVHGNHDPLSGRFSTISWPEGIHVFGDAPSWATATRDGKPLADVQGASYLNQAVTENLATRFTPPRNQELFTIGLLHCNVGGIRDHDNYAPCTVDDLNQIGLDYWALGHIHTRQVLAEGPPTIVYPGNIQGRNPRETGARGCMIVDVQEDGSAVPQFRALDVVRWESREVPITGVVGIDGLFEKIAEVLDALRREADGRDIVCSLSLTGRGPMHAELARTDTVEGLLEELRPEALADSPWVWIERISNATRPELSIDDRSRQDDFLGAVLKRAAVASPSSYEDALAPVFSSRRDRLPFPNEAKVRELLEEARWYLVELLEPEA